MTIDKPEKSKDFDLATPKRKCKKLYLEAKIGLNDALACLVFTHNLEHNQALKYLGL
jgi:hypothetical protein